MAYGRLDVYWPDGPVESYQLEKPALAIGRSTGNDIVLETTAVSRYHITLTYRDSQVFLEDLESANGTYMDGERLQPHQPVVMHGGEEIQIGDIRLIFHPKQTDDDTRPITRDDQVTRRVEIVQPTYRVELDGPDMPVTPGAHVHASLSIQNLGTEADRYFVEVEGVPKDWVRVDRVELELNPDEKAPVVISFKPARRSDSKPGDYAVTVRVRAKSKPNQGVQAPLELRVLSYSGFGVALATSHIETDTPFDLHVHNQGSAPLTIAISGASPEKGLSFDIRPPVITLGPGERRQIQGYVRPPRSLFLGRERERRFDILIRAQDASGFLTAVQGTLIERPSPALWGLVLAVPVVAVLLVAFLGVGLSALNRPRMPIISAFSASPTNIFEGDSVTLSWTVQDAASLSLKVDGQAPVAIDPKRTTLAQVMPAAGEHVFLLIATNGDQSTQREARVVVTKALNIDAFTVTPNPVLRYVQQDVTIEWKVSGATGVRFQGIQGLTGTPDDNTYAAAGTLKLNGTPRDTLELTLIAATAGGKELSQALRVEIANPTCVVNASGTEARGGPGTVYPVFRNLDANTQISPDGRDGSGQWLHLAPAPDPQLWVSVNALSCERFAPTALTLISLIPPTPTLTLTPSPNATTSSMPPATPATAAPSVTPIMVPTATPNKPIIIIVPS